MAECGKRVGAGVVTWPCTVEVVGGQAHAGPCESPDNPASVRKRAAWARAQPKPLVDVLGDPDEVLRHQREGYAPSTPVAPAVDYPPPVPGSHRPPRSLVAPTPWEEKAADRGGQPVPVHIPGEPSTHDLLVTEIEKRKALGLSRYGTILQAGNGRDALQDMLDELIDACVYLIQLKRERDIAAKVRDELEALERGG